MIFLTPLIGRVLVRTPLPKAQGIDVFRMLGVAPNLSGLGAEQKAAPNGPSNDSNTPKPSLKQEQKNSMPAPAPPGPRM